MTQARPSPAAMRPRAALQVAQVQGRRAKVDRAGRRAFLALREARMRAPRATAREPRAPTHRPPAVAAVWLRVMGDEPGRGCSWPSVASRARAGAANKPRERHRTFTLLSVWADVRSPRSREHDVRPYA